MKHQTQVSLIKQLISLHDAERHQDMADEVIRLDSKIYTSDEVLQDELQTVFKDYPILAGHSNQVREPGSYILSDWDKFPYVIVRGNDGELKAFINACRHRGARLVDGTSKSLKAFVCPYHGWSYTLDGKLKAMTRPYNFPDIDKNDCNLRELPVQEQHGLVWIHPKKDRKLDLVKYLGDIADDLQHFNLNNLVTFTKSTTVKKANWKLLLKTYLEGYHVPYLHRHTLQSAFKNGVIAHYEHGPNIRLAAARTNFKDVLKVPQEKWNILEYASVYYSLFPNSFFIMHPDYTSINSFYPLAPNRTIWTHEMLYHPDLFVGPKGQEALQKRFEFTNDMVFDNEDFEVAEGIQSGIQFESDEHLLGLEEGLVGVFQKSVDDAIAGKKRNIIASSPRE